MTPETIDIKERPLITFVLFAYNQERFIREAVEGALSQTYSPLEIILSDDCSLDRTYDVMQKMTAEYKGPHKIILNRNEKNLGIGQHINQVMDLSHGELIVVAAGDDISLPYRTLEIFQAWINSGKKAFSIDSDIKWIDENGNDFQKPFTKRLPLPKEHQLLIFSKTLYSHIHGSSHAWNRKVFDEFGLLPSIILEDTAIPARSMILGDVLQIDKHLIKYRIHGDNIWTPTKKFSVKEIIEREVKFSTDRIIICDDVIRCINEYKGKVKNLSFVCELEECISNFKNSRNKQRLKINLLTDYPLMRIYKLVKYAFFYGLKRSDQFWIACAISITATRLLIYCRRKIIKIVMRLSE
jgi:glycosyltransferase involved in cell wall biosynthesis